MKQADAPVAREAIELLLAGSKVQTILEIYTRIAPAMDGKIRTVPSPVGTETGRFSHSDSWLDRSTNLANLPKKVAKLNALYAVRDCIVPSAGKVFVEIDLSQAEARATAAYAQDKDTLRIFDSGQDIHKHTAMRVFGCTVDEVDFAKRHIGKMCRHALNYGMGWSEFKEQVNKDADLTGVAVSAAEAKEIVDAYRTDNPLLLAWWDKLYRQVLGSNMLTNCFGRQRIFIAPNPRPTDINAYLPQSTVADLCNEGMVRIYDELDPQLVQVVMTLHDAVICEVAPNDVATAAKELQRCMHMPLSIEGITLVIPSDVSVGDCWGEMEAIEAS